MNTNTRNPLPVIALDFEGTLSPAEVGYESTETSFIVPEGSWTVDQWVRKYNWVNWHSVAQPVIDFLTSVHNEGRAEILWLTSYREASHELIGETFGLPEWDIAPNHPPLFNSWWKRNSVSDLINDGRKVIWVDDELASKLSTDDSLFADNNVQFCRVDDPSKGLQQEHIDFIESVLADWENFN